MCIAECINILKTFFKHNKKEDLMGQTSFTSPASRKNSIMNRIKFAFLVPLLFVMTLQNNANAQCSLACNGLVQVSLDANCEATITAAMMLNDTVTLCPGATYVVTVLNYNIPIPGSPIVTRAWVGKTLKVEVKDIISGNKCWGNITIEDKLAPVLECGKDTIPCFAASSFVPAAEDNCDLDTILLVDEQIQPLNCDPTFIKRLVRRYLARDIYGNTSPMCYDTIYLKRFDTAKVLCPKNWIYDPLNPALNCPINCKDICYNRIPLDRNGHPHPDFTGVPLYRDTVHTAPLLIDTIALWPLGDIYCNVGVTYDDIDLGTIGCVHKIMRAWTIREWWCNREVVRTCLQILEIVDREAPYVHAPYDFEATTSGGYKCEATVTIPPAVVFDSCGKCENKPVRVDVVYPGGILKNQNGGVVKLPVGWDTIIYRAYDHCYNESSDTLVIHVADKTAPVAICDRETVVSLSLEGITHVYATTFDDGSYDDCHIDSMLVRRMVESPCDNDTRDEVFKPYVEFCCEDVDRTVTVVFRVKDKHGNVNDCMVQVFVQDKLKPICKAPSNVTVACDYHFNIADLNVFGAINTDSALLFNTRTIRYKGYDWTKDSVITLHDGFAHDNCELTIRHGYNDYRTSCNVGNIVRYWVVSDRNGVDTCWQTITFFNFHPFDLAHDIWWPKDTTLTGCLTAAELTPDRMGRPVAHGEDKCDLVGYNMEDHTFRFVNGSDACFKILRKWKAIDWCQKLPNGAGGYYNPTVEHTQIIKVNNVIAPTMMTNPTKDTTFCTLDSCTSGPVVLTAMGADECTPNDELVWEYLIDLDNNGTYDITKVGAGNKIDASGRYKLGKHKIKFVFEDKCGNKTAKEIIFTIINCKAPTPYCLNGIAVDLMPIDRNGNGIPDWGMVDIWASDVDKGSYHPCGNRVILSFSSDTSKKSITFTCDSLGQRNVELWVTDPVTGQQAFCRTYILIQDNNNACGGTLTTGGVSGLISNDQNSAVADVTVDLVGSGKTAITTSNNGRYAFANMPFNTSAVYTLKAVKDINPTNGITTADIVMIQKHILGVTDITSPYKLIAADVNNSKTITSSDISEIRKLILGITSKFDKNTSWLFVDKNYKFLNAGEDVLKEAYTKEYKIDPFVNSMVIDFYGIKVGDVNGTASATNATGVTSRTSSTLNLLTDEIKMNANEEIYVPIHLADMNELSGYQFTLKFDANNLEFLDIVSGESNLTSENLGMNRLQDGYITFSWNTNKAVQLAKDAKLFTLKFKALSTGQLSNALHINSAITIAEAYDANLDEMNIQLAYRTNNGVITNDNVVLYQNQPNPFSDQTVIGFEMPKAADATLTIYDLNSKVVFSKTVSATKGYNAVTVNNLQLGVTGVLFYQLDAAGYSATRRMLVIQ